MIRMNAVLVATDFGETSDAALVYGRNLARTFGARLHVLHVVEAITARAGQEFYPDDLVAQQTEAVDSAKRQLDDLLAAQNLTAMGARPVIRASGNTVGAIIDYAKEAHVDLIVAGTHGRGPISHLFMGSVAEHVLRHAPCPVLVVRASESELVVPVPVLVHAGV